MRISPPKRHRIIVILVVVVLFTLLLLYGKSTTTHGGSDTIHTMGKHFGPNFEQTDDEDDAKNDNNKNGDVKTRIFSDRENTQNFRNSNDGLDKVVYFRDKNHWEADKSFCRRKADVHLEEIDSPIGNIKVYLPNDNDKHRGTLNSRYNRKGIYESIRNENLLCLHNLLAPDPSSILIDIGGSSGTYCILAAHMMRNVIAIKQDSDQARGLCLSVGLAGIQQRVTIIHQNISSKNTLRLMNNYINVDEEVICDDHDNNVIFNLNSLIELDKYEKYHKVILRIDDDVTNVESLLFCAEEFMLYFDIVAVVMPWSGHDIRKSKVVAFFTKFGMEPHRANIVKEPLKLADVDNWPLYVLWLLKEQDYER